MSRYISESLRAEVALRAKFQCEYCLIRERHSYFAFHLEHIVSIKHKGDSSLENLAYSCPICNLSKGSDIATFIDGNIDQPVRFFHPRRDEWNDHFKIEPTGEIISKTLIGEATMKILDLNHVDSIIERRAMLDEGFLKII